MEDFSGNVGKNYSVPNNNSWGKQTMSLAQGSLTPYIQNRMSSWLEKIDLLLDRLSDARAFPKEGAKDFHDNKLALSVALHSLETENNFLLNKLQTLQSELVVQRQNAKSMSEQTGKSKNRYLQCLAKKNEMISEISFIKEENDSVSATLVQARIDYNNNMAALSKIVEKIRFANGEVEMWAEKMVELEAEIPEQSRELAYLNGQIDSANISLIDLSDKLRAIERNIKTAYYKDQGR